MAPKTDRSIGAVSVHPIGLGAAGFSVPTAMPEPDVARTILAALEAGVTLIDTAACYVPGHDAQGHNESLIAKTLVEWGDRSRVIVATKGGIRRVGSGALTGGDFQADFRTSGRPDDIRRDCDDSLRALGIDRIDLYQLHAPDPDVPITETMGAFADLLAAGKIAAAGLCNVDVATLDAARQVVPIAAVQNRFSPPHREHLDVIRACEERGIAFLAYSPLGGLGQRARELAQQAPELVGVAQRHDVSPHRVALAWELALSPVVIPIPGARRPETIRDSAAAATLSLSADDIAEIESAQQA